jgi:hypothetical protein
MKDQLTAMQEKINTLSRNWGLLLFCHRRIYSGDPFFRMFWRLGLLTDGSPQ